MAKLDILLSPAEYERPFSQIPSPSLNIVFDILRATTSMTLALHHGATSILPTATINQAVQAHEAYPSTLLAGERGGHRITADMSGSIDFHFGNSPREFTKEKVNGRSLVMTTTNGTRALEACKNQGTTIISCFLSLEATVDYIRQSEFPSLRIICAGTGDNCAYEDILAAGALATRLFEDNYVSDLTDAAYLAIQCYQREASDLLNAAHRAANGRRLLKLPEFREDVALCMNVSSQKLNILAMRGVDGHIRATRSQSPF